MAQDVAQDEAQRRSAGGRADRGSIVAGPGTVEKQIEAEN